MRAMDDSGGAPSPGGLSGSDGGGSTNPPPPSFSYTLDTNGLWLEMDGVTNEMAAVILHRKFPGELFITY